MTQKINCWEYMNCGRGPRGRNVKSKGMCPAAREKRLHRIHGGINSGRACWVVAGTYCGGTIQGSYVKKNISCKRCDFYQKVQHEENSAVKKPQELLTLLKDPSTRFDITTKRLGILLGGSGLIGGALMHYFKKKVHTTEALLSPNSKKLSLREPEDIRNYIQKFQPDFIINCAIAALDSDAQMAYETNYLGSIRLAKMALALKIPYIHFSSAAILPAGENITEEQQVDLQPDMSNYAKSKLMTEKTLQYLHETQGLDYTVIRLAVVYGKHDHKIQGFHRLLFAIANQAMPFILSKPGISHSYTHSKKIPPFVNYILDNRGEFTGQTFNFADHQPVELVSLIKTIKKKLQTKTPRELYIPYPLARFGKKMLTGIVKRLERMGVETRIPAEMMFIENFYHSQTLNTDKLQNSSYEDDKTDVTVYSELETMIRYYLTRWHHMNRLSTFSEEFMKMSHPADDFLSSPQELLDSIHQKSSLPIEEFDKAVEL